ncbi:HEAT repeat domain-containing protein [Cellulomonas soli]
MTHARTHEPTSPLHRALSAPSPSTRLRAALAAGSTPSVDDVEVLVARCALEPDFAVRDMLTWALVRNDTARVVERLLVELTSDVAQARAQALHTLSKIGRPGTWRAVTALLRDDDDEVARTAWRTAVGLVPPGQEITLAGTLVSQLGRGGPEVRRSLSRALVALGDATADAVTRATSHPDPDVRAHAVATERLLQDPDEGFEAALDEARRVVALRTAPAVRA